MEPALDDEDFTVGDLVNQAVLAVDAA